MTPLRWPNAIAALQVAPLPTLDMEPVTVADVVAHLKWPTGTPDEVNIPRWIAAARAIVERDTGLALVPQVWDLFFDAVDMAPGYVRVPLSPVASVLASIGSAGAETPVDAGTYGAIIARPSRVLFTTAPVLPSSGGMRLRVTYTGAVTPPDLALAILMLTADFALHRGDESERTDERTEAGARDLIERHVLPEA